MLKRLALVLVLLCTLARAQGGPYAVPGIAFNPVSVTTAVTNYNPQLAPFPVYINGTVVAVLSGLTGSPASCQISLSFAGRSSATLTVLTSITVAPVNGTTFTRTIGGSPVTVYSGPYNTVGVGWTCSTFPTGGTLNVEFIPDPQPGFYYSNIQSNANTQIRSVGGTLHSLVINSAGTSETITIVDTSSGTCTGGQQIASTTGFSNAQIFVYDVTFLAGLCVTTSGTTAGNYTVTYR